MFPMPTPSNSTDPWVDIKALENYAYNSPDIFGIVSRVVLKGLEYRFLFKLQGQLKGGKKMVRW